jgi:hypothetical protein
MVPFCDSVLSMVPLSVDEQSGIYTQYLNDSWNKDKLAILVKSILSQGILDFSLQKADNRQLVSQTVSLLTTAFWKADFF